MECTKMRKVKKEKFLKKYKVLLPFWITEENVKEVYTACDFIEPPFDYCLKLENGDLVIVLI